MTQRGGGCEIAATKRGGGGVMRLKQLELGGFKSFAHRTVLDFPAGIAAVVGPNGCGKSNIVDAIRWVLGEQSPKHLRGDSMEDVIFKGNDRVAPLGMAHVSLTFLNEGPPRVSDPEGLGVSTVPAHLRDLPEITISRRYLRSGESEYFINKTPCRLKDITELFLGTGVGTKAYSIIEQGRVEQLVNAKPEDRRLFIEEAAGTTLYRSRKLAAERKMERTRENLLRVSDVLREVDRQIQYLNRMARRAEQYRSLQEELRHLELQLGSVRWRRLMAAIAAVEAELRESRDAEHGAQERLVACETQREAEALACTTAEHGLAARREAAAVVDAERQALGERNVLLRKECEERERRRTALDAERGLAVEQRSRAEHSYEDQEQAQAASAAALAADEQRLAAREAELEEARSRLALASAEVEDLKASLVGLAAREAEGRNVVATQTRRREEAERRAERARSEQEESSGRLAALDAEDARQRAVVADLRDRLHRAEGEREQRAERVRTLAGEGRDWARKAQASRDVLVQARSRWQSLRDLQSNYEGYQRGVRSVLLDEQRAEGVLGVVGEVIGVAAEHERALAAALGDRLQYVIVEQADVGLGAVSRLRSQDSGRGSFIPLTPRRVPVNGNGAARMNGTTRPLLDLVDVEEPYRLVAETLLGDVVLVPDLDAGLSLWRQNGIHVTMVTPSGEVIDATGVITGGSERPLEEAILARRRVLAELEAEAAAAEAELAEAEREMRCLDAEISREEAALKVLSADAHALTVELVAGEKALERLEAERPRWIDRLEVARFEAAAAASEAADSALLLTEACRQAEALATERAEVEGRLRECQGRTSEGAARVDALNREVLALRVGVAQGRERIESARAAIDALGTRIGELRDREATLGREIERTDQERATLDAAAAEAAAGALRLAEERAAIEAEVNAARAAVEAAAGALAAQEQRARALRDEIGSFRARAGQLEIAAAEDRLRAEHLSRTIEERYAVVLADEPAVELDVAEDEAQARLDGLREKLGRFGEVNVAAIAEVQDLEERARFLRTQKDDLERSLGDLDRTIQRLNRASKARFAETFAAVNERFQALVPRLFRGGEARLVLTDDRDILASGVDIVVRPPGKRVESIASLSGGEKALVAVGLIFSLFLINPTPFCFLDEVDAPLDDANIGRFTELVEEVSQHSQFIVITHNKRTMQAAGVLYGVTMEEPGLSKIISVSMR